jgi:nicotinate-nucleotide adenylyltransferase
MTAARPPAILFGGTFDPPHLAHVTMASAAADALNARAILVVPAAVNPQRTATPPAPAADRLAMVRLAFAKEPRAEVLDLELRRPGPSYTIDTLHALIEAGHAPLRLLIGSDQALNVPTWRAWREVVELAPPAIVVRPPLTLDSIGPELDRVYGAESALWRARVLGIPPMPLSATAARASLAHGDAAADLDPAVLAYIRAQRLYAVEGPGPTPDARG